LSTHEFDERATIDRTRKAASMPQTIGELLVAARARLDRLNPIAAR
jgi:hypothetical protein